MKKRLSIVAVLLLIAVIAQAQYNETNNLFYHTQRTPQSNKLNPALYPTNNTFYISTVGPEIRFGSPLSLGDVLKDSGNVTYVDLNNILNKMTNDNRFRLGFDLDLFGFGFKTGNLFFTFNTGVRTSLSFGLPLNTVAALLEGNVDDNGNAKKKVTLLDGNLFNAQMYLEHSLGAGYQIEPINLTVGARVKMLSGIFNIQTDNTRVVIETEDGYDEVTAKIYYQMQAASVVPFDTTGGSLHLGLSGQSVNEMSQSILKEVGSLFNPFSGNVGIAFDLGARYELGNFTFSASINDLSAGIHWQRNVASLEPNGGQGVIKFDGLEIQNILNHGSMNTDSLVAQISSQMKSMTPTLRPGADYWYNVPTKINLAANYNFAKIFRAGLLLHGQFDRGLLSKKNQYEFDFSDNIKNTFRFNTTASVGMNLFNWVEVIVGNSFVYDGDKLNLFSPGAGLILTPFSVAQVYIMADYLSSVYLADAKAFNLKVGFNLLFGKGGRHKIVDE